MILMMIFISKTLLLIAIIIFFAIILTPLFKQRNKLNKEREIIEAQDKKLKEMNKKQEDGEDFTEGHLYE